MNISPKKDVNGTKIKVTCMNLEEKDNELKKGQEVGDATNIQSAGETEIMDNETPKIDINVGEYEVTDNGYRIMPNGKILVCKVIPEKRKMQLAIIKQQQEEKQKYINNTKKDSNKTIGQKPEKSGNR